MSFQRRRARLGLCFDCGHVWTDEEMKNRDLICRHMIDQHGYKQVCGHVFKSTACILCDKPALYRADGNVYCKDHYDVAKGKAVRETVRHDMRNSVTSDRIHARDVRDRHHTDLRHTRRKVR